MTIELDPMRGAHEASKLRIESLLQMIESSPDLKAQVQSTIKKYGVPFTSGGFGARWKEDLAKDVYEILFNYFPHHPVEVTIRPEDGDYHHWSIEYQMLVWNEEKQKFEKAY